MRINDFKDLNINLENLPFDKNALEPFISEETINYHYNKHHQAYVIKTLSLVEEKKEKLLHIIKNSSGRLFNNSAQILNHHIFWLCLQNGLREKENNFIEKYFGTKELFENQFVECGLNTFGSGWVWILKNENKVYIKSSTNGNIPEEVLDNSVDIVTLCDVWEHAYYIDYRNDRKRFLEIFTNHLMKIQI